MRGEDRRSEQHFLHIYLTTFFGVHSFKNTSAMRVIFFLKLLQLNLNFQNAKKKKKKKKSEKVFRF